MTSLSRWLALAAAIGFVLTTMATADDGCANGNNKRWQVLYHRENANKGNIGDPPCDEQPPDEDVLIEEDIPDTDPPPADYDAEG